MEAFKIKWNIGGETAEAYSNKRVASHILKNAKYKGKVIPFNLGSETHSMLGYPIVWTESKTKYGKVFRTRKPSALQSSEKVVKDWWK